MPFLPLFIVIGIFLATSKILQPSNQQQLQSASEDYDEKLLNQALIDYIARESRSQDKSRYGGTASKATSSNKKASSHRR